jgi:hypothetical protein
MLFFALLFLHTAGTLVRLYGHGNFFVCFSDLILDTKICFVHCLFVKIAITVIPYTFYCPDTDHRNFVSCISRVNFTARIVLCTFFPASLATTVFS